MHERTSSLAQARSTVSPHQAHSGVVSESLESAAGRVWAIVTIGLVALWLTVPPLAGLLKPPEAVDLAENRELAALPAWPNSLEALPVWFAGVSDYLRDHVGFRTAATILNARALYAVNDSSNQNILFGTKKFLFTRTVRSRNDLIEEELGRRLLSPADIARLEEQWADNATEAQKRGLPYLIAIVPNKGVVYPDRMPPIGRFVSDHRMLQQVRVAAEAAGATLLDVTDVLQEGRKERLVWYPRDTHWNSYGALLAYNRIGQEIAGRFGLKVSQIPRDEWSFVRTPRVMDIARLMGLGEAASDATDAARLKKRPKILNQVMTPERGFMYFEMDNPGAPVLLATHDSFIWSILPFLQHGFSKIILTQGSPTKIPWELVDQHQPDLILSLSVEKGLLYFQADPRMALD